MASPIYHEEALIHFQRALMLERADRYDEAVREYRRALAHDPYLCDARRALASYYRQRGLLSKAVDELRAVIAIRSDFFTHLQLVELLLEIGYADEALEHVRHCLAIVPDDANVHRLAALAHMLQGDVAAAQPHVRASLLRDPEHWQTHQLLGDCRLRLGEFDAANDAFKVAQRLAPSDSARALVAARLRLVERHRLLGTSKSVRDRFFAEHGAVYLGSSQCDGRRPAFEEECFLTYPDIGVTLLRFHALCQQLEWRFDAVVPIDRTAQPLATALSALLSVQLCSPEAVVKRARPLLVGVGGRQIATLALAAARAPAAMTICLGLSEIDRQTSLPHVVGVATRAVCSAPWESELQRLRAEGAPASQVTSCLERAAHRLAEAIAAAPADLLLDEIVLYYQHLLAPSQQSL